MKGAVLETMIDEHKSVEDGMRETLDYIITSLLINHAKYKEISMKIIKKILTTDMLAPYFQ